MSGLISSLFGSSSTTSATTYVPTSTVSTTTSTVVEKNLATEAYENVVIDDVTHDQEEPVVLDSNESVNKAAVNKTVTEKASAEKTAVEDAPVKDAPVNNTPVNNTPGENVKDSTVNDTRVNDAVSNDTTAESNTANSADNAANKAGKYMCAFFNANGKTNYETFNTFDDLLNAVLPLPTDKNVTGESEKAPSNSTQRTDNIDSTDKNVNNKDDTISDKDLDSMAESMLNLLLKSMPTSDTSKSVFNDIFNNVLKKSNSDSCDSFASNDQANDGPVSSSSASDSPAGDSSANDKATSGRPPCQDSLMSFLNTFSTCGKCDTCCKAFINGISTGWEFPRACNIPLLNKDIVFINDKTTKSENAEFVAFRKSDYRTVQSFTANCPHVMDFINMDVFKDLQTQPSVKNIASVRLGHGTRVSFYNKKYNTKNSKKTTKYLTVYGPVFLNVMANWIAEKYPAQKAVRFHSDKLGYDIYM